MNISDEIKKANSFGDQIENLVVARGACPTGDRNTLLGYWSLMFDHHRGILSTLSNSFCGSAFALVRPMVEAAVRSHVTMLGSDDDLAKLHDDTYRTNFGTIGKWIDTTFHMEAYFETFLKGAKDALHSYTHAGMRQIERRFTGTDLVANYNDGEIVEVIRVSCSAIFMVNNLSRSVSTLKKNGMKITGSIRNGKALMKAPESPLHSHFGTLLLLFPPNSLTTSYQISDNGNIGVDTPVNTLPISLL